jgi:hypothetical protein
MRGGSGSCQLTHSIAFKRAMRSTLNSFCLFRVFPSKIAPRSRRAWIPLPPHVLTPSATAGVSTNGMSGLTNPKIHATQRTHYEIGLVLPLSPFTSPLGEPSGNGRYSLGQVPLRGCNQQVLSLRTILSYTCDVSPQCDPVCSRVLRTC